MAAIEGLRGDSFATGLGVRGLLSANLIERGLVKQTKREGRVGLGIAVGNARPEVKSAALHVTEAKGGQGAVREVCEMILQAKGLWDQLLVKYEVK